LRHQGAILRRQDLGARSNNDAVGLRIAAVAGVARRIAKIRLANVV